MHIYMNLNIYTRYDLQTAILKEISKSLGLGSGLEQTIGSITDQSKSQAITLFVC